MATRFHTFDETSAIFALGGIVCACQKTIMEIEKSKYSFSSSSSAKAWDLLPGIGRLSYKTKKEAEAAKQLLVVSGGEFRFNASIICYDQQGDEYISNRAIIIDAPICCICASNPHMEVDDFISPIELLQRYNAAQDWIAEDEAIKEEKENNFDCFQVGA